MSNNHTPHSNAFQTRRQPIHFYAAPRNSVHDMYHHGIHITSATSPVKYFSSKISPIKPHSSTTLNRTPETQLNADRALNSSYPSKYAKLTAKIQMLEKNLNRLNGQHQSLGSMFQRSQELASTTQIFVSIDRFRQRLEQSKRNKHIEQKRYQARHQVVYEDWMKRFEQLTQKSFKIQKEYIAEAESRNKTLSGNTPDVNIYDKIRSQNLKKIVDLEANTSRYMSDLDDTMRKQVSSILKKMKIQQKIAEEQTNITQKVKQIKLKLGEAKCMAEYEIFLAKESQVTQQINSLRTEFEIGKKQLSSEQKEHKMNMLQLGFTKDEMKFVAIESLDRLTFHLANIDCKFLKTIHKYEAKHKKICRTQKHKLNPTNLLFSNSKIGQKATLDCEIDQIKSELSTVGYELLGLKKYFHNSIKKITNIEAGCNIEPSKKDQLQVNELTQSIEEFGQKVNILNSSLAFFNSKCSNP